MKDENAISFNTFIKYLTKNIIPFNSWYSNDSQPDEFYPSLPDTDTFHDFIAFCRSGRKDKITNTITTGIYVEQLANLLREFKQRFSQNHKIATVDDWYDELNGAYNSMTDES